MGRHGLTEIDSPLCSRGVLQIRAFYRIMVEERLSGKGRDECRIGTQIHLVPRFRKRAWR